MKMIFGLVRDYKNGENRTIATPREIASIVNAGFTAVVQMGAGERAGFPDEKYAAAGAKMVPTMEDVYREADFVVKVKEVQEPEYELLREGQIVMSAIHPAGHPKETWKLLEKKVTAFAAEDSHRYGAPNSEAAGKQGALYGLESLLTTNGGKGKLVCGLAGAPGINAVVIGGGYAGKGAVQILNGLGAHVTVLDINVSVLREFEYLYHMAVNTMVCTKEAIAELLPTTDLVVNCVRWPKQRKDFLIDRPMLSLMEKGSVIVDVADDDPGCIETSHETSHDDPRYTVDGIVHYCVSNIPSAVANTASAAYGSVMLKHFLSILQNGVAEACVRDGYLRRCMVCYNGILTNEETSVVHNVPWLPPEKALGIEDRKLDPAPPSTVTRSYNFIR